MVLMGFVTKGIYRGIQEGSVLFLIHSFLFSNFFGYWPWSWWSRQSTAGKTVVWPLVSTEPRIFLSGNSGKIKEIQPTGEKLNFSIVMTVVYQDASQSGSESSLFQKAMPVAELIIQILLSLVPFGWNIPVFFELWMIKYDHCVELGWGRGNKRNLFTQIYSWMS